MARLLAIHCLLLLLCVALRAQEPGVPLVSTPSRGETLSGWSVRAAQDAARAGFPGLARSLFERLVAEGYNPGSEPDSLKDYASALIALNESAEALRVLEASPYPTAAWWRLRAGLAHLQAGQAERATGLLEGIFPTDLEPAERAWLYLGQGLLAQAQEKPEARTLLEKAVQEASEKLKAQFELILLREQLVNGRAQETVIPALRQRVRDMQGQKGGFEAARLLAIALHQLGRTQEAVQVLEEQLRFVTAGEDGVRDSFHLLIGMIIGPDSGRGRLALQQVLQNPAANRRLHENALSLLRRNLTNDEARRAFRQLLDELLSAPVPHPMMDELLMLRAEMALQEGADEAAATEARRLIELFPGSSLRSGAVRMLAYIAWRRQPPQYRTAASHLAQLRENMQEGPERARLGVLLADCFFLNGDFQSAANAYADVRDEPVASPGRVLYQQVLSHLRAGNLDAAHALLAEPSARQIDAESRWRAEWNVVNTMKASGDVVGAFARLAALLEGGVAQEPPPSLRLRLMWLEAQLSIDVGQPEETPERCDAILENLDALPVSLLGENQRQAIASHTLLLKAQAQFLLQEADPAVEELQRLRALYPQSEAAQLSYLVQAREYAAADRLVEAQRLLIALADRYPRSAQAPVALWEAAISAELRGIDSTYREALSILDRLIADYPQHFLGFQARLRQGDLLRRLNDFATAQLIYEDLINRFPEHPDVSLAWLSRADCYIAQTSQQASLRQDALAIYERLLEQADLASDLRAEAGFKWAYALDRSGDSSRARTSYWLVLRRFTSAEEAGLIGPRGRYWIGRVAVELGQLLEGQSRFEQAREVYELALAANLPGESLIRFRLTRLTEPR